MARLIPKVLLTALAVYVIWADTRSTEPISTASWVIDALIVALAVWSWAQLFRQKPATRS